MPLTLRLRDSRQAGGAVIGRLLGSTGDPIRCCRATCNGREAILTFLREQLDAMDLKQDIEQISVNGDCATAYVISTKTGSDGEQQQAMRWADLFHFDGDRICQHVSLAG